MVVSGLKKSSGVSVSMGYVGFGKKQLAVSVLKPQEFNPGPLDPGLTLESRARSGPGLFPGRWVLDFSLLRFILDFQLGFLEFSFIFWAGNFRKEYL